MTQTVTEIAAAVRSRKLTARDVTERALERIEKLDDPIGAFQEVRVFKALHEADAIDARVDVHALQRPEQSRNWNTIRQRPYMHRRYIRWRNRYGACLRIGCGALGCCARTRIGGRVAAGDERRGRRAQCDGERDVSDPQLRRPLTEWVHYPWKGGEVVGLASVQVKRPLDRHRRSIAPGWSAQS